MFGMSAAFSKKTLIAVAAMGMLIVAAGLFVPAYIRARNARSAACVDNLIDIAGAKKSWAIENLKSTNDTPVWHDIEPFFLRPGISCPQGGTYIVGRVGEPPKCSVGGAHALPQ